MTKELAAARDDTLSKAEIAIFLTREWLTNQGAPIQAEIDNAHALAARYLMLDMNRTEVPDVQGTTFDLVETLPDGRTIQRVAGGVAAGSYVSFPTNVESFVTYGNTVSFAQVNEERLRALRETAQADRP